MKRALIPDRQLKISEPESKPVKYFKEDSNLINDLEGRFHKAINDDLNMPLAMGIVWEVVKLDKKSEKIARLLEKFDEVMGLDLKNYKNYIKGETQIEIPEEIQKILEERKKARENKNWEESDRIRDLIKEKGYEIKDTKEGTEVRFLGTEDFCLKN